MARQPDDKTNAKFTSDDSALIRELALLLDETSLTEIEIERAGLRVRVARNISIAASMQPGVATVAAAAPATSATATPSAPVANFSNHPGVVPSPRAPKGTALSIRLPRRAPTALSIRHRRRRQRISSGAGKSA